MSKTSKKADAFLQTHSNALQSIFIKVKLLENLNQQIAIFLDEGLKSACQVVNLIGGTLTILVSSGSVATQLRFLEPGLLIKFQSHPTLKKIQHIHCKVRPPQIPLRKTKALQKIALLSTETAAIIHDMADSIDDQKLKEVLKKIAAHTHTPTLPPK
jgi:hypothetical protein